VTEPAHRYDVEISGWLTPTHRITGRDGEVGVLEVARGRFGIVSGARFVPRSGEVLTIRRDPGLLRSQYSVWTEGREWLGSSLRWHFLRREIVLHTGSRPLRMLPLRGFRSGWSLLAPRTGELARVLARPLSRRARIEVYGKVDLELLFFAYFIGSQVLVESLWPGPAIDEGPAAASAARG
jgi:hypothetical protein